MTVGVVLFTRDLRLHDNPVLWHAVHSHERVVPVFVLDAAILSGGFNRPNRPRFSPTACATWTRRCARGAPG